MGNFLKYFTNNLEKYNRNETVVNKYINICRIKVIFKNNSKVLYFFFKKNIVFLNKINN